MIFFLKLINKNKMETRASMFSTAEKRSTLLENKVIELFKKISQGRRALAENQNLSERMPSGIQILSRCKIKSV